MDTPSFFVALLVFALATVPAAAQDALNGKRLYLDTSRIAGSGSSCVDCHGGLPGGAFAIGAAANDPARIARAIDAIPPMAIFRGRLSPEQLADLAAYTGNPAVASPDVRFGAGSAIDRVDFGVVSTGTGRGASLILANVGAIAVTLQSAQRIVGQSAADFSFVPQCMPGPLAAGAHCAIELTFQPRGATSGPRTAALQIDHDWVGGTSAVALLANVEATSAVSPIGPSGGGGGVAPLLVLAA